MNSLSHWERARKGAKHRPVFIGRLEFLAVQSLMLS